MHNPNPLYTFHQNPPENGLNTKTFHYYYLHALYRTLPKLNIEGHLYLVKSVTIIKNTFILQSDNELVVVA